MAALDIDSRQIDTSGGIDQQVPAKPSTSWASSGFSKVADRCRSKPICAGSSKSGRIFKVAFRKRLLRREGTYIADSTDFVGNYGVIKAIGRPQTLR